MTKIGQLLLGIAMMLSRHASNASPRYRRVLAGIGLAVAGLPMLWHSGYAQTFTAQEISNYAAAVVEMEDIRRQTYADISDLMTIANEDVTRYNLQCLSTDALSTLPRTIRSQVRRLLIDYCNDAQAIVQDTGLTPQLFNSITVNHQQDEALAEQIQSEIVKIR
ncbi:MAG: DUF4168 domain-containing protein [Leptolyngbyaceae cyanobacterium]